MGYLAIWDAHCQLYLFVVRKSVYAGCRDQIISMVRLLTNVMKAGETSLCRILGFLSVHFCFLPG